ncbi:hypothetical protein Tco_0600216 [Tanacetum coccineum]|uniref:Reverse transcriptase domain-containing protein n=1 Tax=Tanacetum coccineum TaxID=301880 RepID=A0ABQ4WB96_9ASTR
MLRSCPHHGFSELTQVDIFYNGLTENEQDSLNATASGNLLSKNTREALHIIENKSKVRYLRNKTNASRVNSRENVVTPAPVKAVEENCVTCGGAHAWYNCPATDNNQNVCATTGTYNQQAPPNRVSNQMAPPGFASGFKSVERETEEIIDEEQNNFHGSTAQIPPLVISKPIPEPEIPKTLPKSTSISKPEIPKTVPKANIPYPSR